MAIANTIERINAELSLLLGSTPSQVLRRFVGINAQVLTSSNNPDQQRQSGFVSKQ